MKSLLELIKLLYGKNALTKTIGTRTNVISLSNKKLEKYIRDELNIEAASDAAAVNALKEMEKLIVDVPKMNDSERLIFEGNLRRTKNKLQASGIIEPDQTADVLSMSTKKPVSEEGIKQLIKEGGQKNPPGSLLGNIESRLNKIKATTEEMKKISGKETVGDFLNDYFGLSKSKLTSQKEGLVRSTARQILYSDIKSGKLKAPKEIEDLVMGRTSGDPIDTFRNLYGEDALQQLDDLAPEIGTLTREADAEALARSKFNFEPKLDRPKEAYTDAEIEAILSKDKDRFAIKPEAEVVDIKNKVSKNLDPDQLIEEYNSNYKLLSQTDEEGGTLIGYEQFNKLQNRNTEIEKILDSIGIKTAPKVKPEGTVIPFKKDDPDKFAGGGSVGLDYLMGIERPYATGGRAGFYEGSSYDEAGTQTTSAQMDAATGGGSNGGYYDTAGQQFTTAQIDSALRGSGEDSFNKNLNMIDTGLRSMGALGNLRNAIASKGLVSFPAALALSELYSALKSNKNQTAINNLEPLKSGLAQGGRVSYANGSEEAKSITLDSHDKAPENFDKYPVKLGPLELGASGSISFNKNDPDPYTDVNTLRRELSIRGKYNVPETSLSLTGGIGDIRDRANVTINDPEYNYYKKLELVNRQNPYSIGAEYKLGPDSLISGSRDSTDGRDTYNLGYKYGPVSIDYRDSPEGKDIMARLRMPFAKGGLAYLMGF